MLTNLIAHSITVQLARLILVDPSSIETCQGLILASELDSLVGVEMRSYIMRQFERAVAFDGNLAPQPVWSVAEKVAGRSKKIIDKYECITSIETLGNNDDHAHAVECHRRA
nr:hypothetical protein CFP56_21591 [Quercus suber]